MKITIPVIITFTIISIIINNMNVNAFTMQQQIQFMQRYPTMSQDEKNYYRNTLSNEEKQQLINSGMLNEKDKIDLQNDVAMTNKIVVSNQNEIQNTNLITEQGQGNNTINRGTPSIIDIIMKNGKNNKDDTNNKVYVSEDSSAVSAKIGLLGFFTSIVVMII